MAGATKLITAGGGGVSLTPASSIAADVTVNVPSQNCTLGIQGPAFSVYKSADQAISSATSTKVTFDVEVFDTNNNFLNSTFTPTVSGYYQINADINLTGNPFTVALSDIYKNGALYKRIGQLTISSVASATEYSCNGSVVIYMNGTTDYLEMYGYVSAVSGTAIRGNSGGAITTFSGSLVRAA